MTDDLYYRKLENTSTTDLVDMIREKDKNIAELKETVIKMNNVITETFSNLAKAKEIISEWEDSFCCGADYLYLGNKGKELRSKSQKFLNSEVKK
jgi:hypothetical protein